jgi:hypothetical protein
MADTLSLDAAIAYVVDRGGSVRLIGDDQQLAAIGAGGVLRDIQTTHGAARLTEPVRFTDPAEAAATLALRDGKPEAIGFYLDNQRVHVGDLSSITEQVFAAWQHDRSDGLDSLMLAPTRELVAQLNQRARTHRLVNAQLETNVETTLADGNRAGVGELIITRSNDRRLRLTATDWVKNGVPAAALHHADPRKSRQPPLPANRRGRRPPQHPLAGHGTAFHAHRPPRTNPGARRRSTVGDHPAT